VEVLDIYYPPEQSEGQLPTPRILLLPFTTIKIASLDYDKKNDPVRCDKVTVFFIESGREKFQ
jgi:hypothetical protein